MCIYTPFGAYQFKRLPFGISCAPEFFQKLTYKYFGNIKNVCVYIDDILISGENLKEHDEALDQVVKVARDINIKFNLNKLQLRKDKIKYLGFQFNEKGVIVDEEKVKSIAKLRSPTNIKELQSILGMINYLRAFIPQMSEIIGPMKDLLKKDCRWDWNQN